MFRRPERPPADAGEDALLVLERHAGGGPLMVDRTHNLFRRGLLLAGLLIVGGLLGGCGTNGDFGRVRPSLRTDDMHAWVGAAAAENARQPISNYRLTDEERLLRDLAYPLIEPPYERQRWISVLNEYGVSRAWQTGWYSIDHRLYYRQLQGEAHRSPSGQYGKLNEDIRNDVERVPGFFSVSAKVADLDSRRRQSLAFVSELTREERADALARITENALVASWVCRSLADRIRSYRYALERLVIATPSPLAVDAERSLTLLQSRIAECRGPFPPVPPTFAIISK
jgi:hypothetical protein